MTFQGVEFITISSTNHASPTGALPFLLPAPSPKNPGEAVLPVPSTRIERWVCEEHVHKKPARRFSSERREERHQHAETSSSTKRNSTSKEYFDIRYEAYMSLLNCRIRNAYVGQLGCSLSR